MTDREPVNIMGVGIGSEMNFTRAFNWRGQAMSKKMFRFSNSLEGFQSFLAYLECCKSNALKSVPLYAAFCI